MHHERWCLLRSQPLPSHSAEPESYNTLSLYAWYDWEMHATYIVFPLELLRVHNLNRKLRSSDGSSQNNGFFTSIERTYGIHVSCRFQRQAEDGSGATVELVEPQIKLSKTGKLRVDHAQFMTVSHAIFERLRLVACELSASTKADTGAAPGSPGGVRFSKYISAGNESFFAYAATMHHVFSDAAQPQFQSPLFCALKALFRARPCAFLVNNQWHWNHSEDDGDHFSVLACFSKDEAYSLHFYGHATPLSTERPINITVISYVRVNSQRTNKARMLAEF
jgi:hypothetical protein